jgi:hypothetical protein
MEMARTTPRGAPISAPDWPNSVNGQIYFGIGDWI